MDEPAPRPTPDPCVAPSCSSPPRGPLLPARRLLHRSDAPGGARADHARPLRPRHGRPRRGARHAGDARHHGDPARARTSPGRRRSRRIGEPRARSAASAVTLPSGRPRARLGADRGGGGRAAHRRGRRLQARARPDLRGVRAGRLRRLHHRGDLRPAGVPPSARRGDEIAKLLASLAQFPERTHLVGVYALGKAQRVIRLLRDGGLRRADLPPRRAAPALRLLRRPRGSTSARSTTRRWRGAAAATSPGRWCSGRPRPSTGAWVRRFADPLIGFASGWMQVRARARQRGVELPLIVSDHCDWTELTATHHRTRARRGLGDARPRGGAGALVRAARPAGAAAAPRRLRGRGGD